MIADTEFKDRYYIVSKVLASVDETIIFLQVQHKDVRVSRAFSDALIKRAGHMSDTFLRYLELYLEKIGMVQGVMGGPHGVLRTAYQASCITADEYGVLLDAMQDRAAIPYAYDHVVAKEIVQRIPNYYAVIKMVTERLKP